MGLADFVPIPDLLQCRNLLCIQPHPDDTEVGAGGTIARLIESGARVTYLTVTDGRQGTDNPAITPEMLAATRRQEQADAAAGLGVQELCWLDEPDGELVATLALRKRIIEVVRRVKPDAILTCDPWLAYEAHPDHRACGFLAAEAFLQAALVHAYPEAGPAHSTGCIAFYATGRPNTVVDVTAYYAQKLQAIGAHRSQFPPETFPMYAGFFTLQAQEVGGRKGYERGEAFKVLTALHLHFQPETEHL